uniref:ARAD1C10516p n=1 Tax=Blastobotrys adeninivorans TaxID=409370 RepID=A0A060T072_BLAAD
MGIMVAKWAIGCGGRWHGVMEGLSGVSIDAMLTSAGHGGRLLIVTAHGSVVGNRPRQVGLVPLLGNMPTLTTAQVARFAIGTVVDGWLVCRLLELFPDLCLYVCAVGQLPMLNGKNLSPQCAYYVTHIYGTNCKTNPNEIKPATQAGITTQ